MAFSETNLWREAYYVIETLIDVKDCSAHEFIKKRVVGEDSELLNAFGQYTLEFIAVHVLSVLFSLLDQRARVRASTLIEHLESTIRRQAFLIKRNDGEKKKKEKEEAAVDQRKQDRMFPLGIALLQFMVSRDVISLETDQEALPPRRKKNKKGDKECNPGYSAKREEVEEALLYHYKSYPSQEDANIDFNEVRAEAQKQGRDEFLQIAREARHPFQLIAPEIALVLEKWEGFPVTKDASASAFQIMSYFLLDEDLANSANLLPFKDNKIQDIYTNIFSELKDYLVRELGNNSLSLIVIRRMDRKMVKSIFMPMIYGKTLMSTSSDIHKTLSQHINFKDSYILASVCFKFWKEKYKSMDSLTSLIMNIGSFAVAGGVPVYYGVPYFRTSQDYMKSDVIKITVYDRNKKRRQISLRVNTDNRDLRKTEVSTFVNFIHQKDAYIAILVVEKVLIEGGPIYTVHDNFITTPHYSRKLPSLYGDAILALGPPLAIINDMIYANLVRNADGFSPGGLERVIPIGELESYLENNMPNGISKMETKDEGPTSLIRELY
ncbi:hypothetical protein K7X08_008601 [Anisodus acutangulus]|uniref:DNA-directed RNA polymerase n=1 Tax=Anisodus acutangulus TaxID=402998 RepID=A0A9Q1MQZ0_9SOLA|nr:hypothetical protein K7X08_008601 [Anisodus acutangulus]